MMVVHWILSPIQFDVLDIQQKHKHQTVPIFMVSEAPHNKHYDDESFHPYLMSHNGGRIINFLKT
jgi:hypothetical protein